jgi:hypothetical protein
VRRSNVGRAEQRPPCIEPAGGQSFEHFAESSAAIHGEQPAHVLEEHSTRLALLDDVCDLWPDPPLVVSSEALPGCACGLAGEACGDEIERMAQAALHTQLGNITDVDNARCQISARHPRRQDGGSVGVALDVGAVLDFDARCFDPTLESSDAGAEREHPHIDHTTRCRFFDAFVVITLRGISITVTSTLGFVLSIACLTCFSRTCLSFA